MLCRLAQRLDGLAAMYRIAHAPLAEHRTGFVVREDLAEAEYNPFLAEGGGRPPEDETAGLAASLLAAAATDDAGDDDPAFNAFLDAAEDAEEPSIDEAIAVLVDAGSEPDKA